MHESRETTREFAVWSQDGDSQATTTKKPLSLQRGTKAATGEQLDHGVLKGGKEHVVALSSHDTRL